MLVKICLSLSKEEAIRTQTVITVGYQMLGSAEGAEPRQPDRPLISEIRWPPCVAGIWLNGEVFEALGSVSSTKGEEGKKAK